MDTIINTIIIGAGHSGLLASYYLTKEGIEHIILEKDFVGASWTRDRWDSFSLITPNWMNNFPGIDPMDFANENELLTGIEIQNMIKRFKNTFNPKILENTNVSRITIDNNENFNIFTEDNKIFLCENLIIATGRYNKQFIPKVSEDFPNNICQMHSGDYKNPQSLPEGNAIVAGTGRSGTQIAIELSKYGKKVFLYSGKVKVFPPIINNTSGVYWLNRLSGYGDGTFKSYSSSDMKNSNILEKLKISIFDLPENITLLGRLVSYEDGFIINDDSLEMNIKNCSVFSEKFLEKIRRDYGDDFAKNLDTSINYQNILEINKSTHLDINKENITSIIWATGFKMDMEIFDIDNLPSNCSFLDKNNCTINNLYFLTSSLNPKIDSNSGFSVGLYGARYDAIEVIKKIKEKGKSN